MTTFGDRVFQSGGVPVGGDLLGLIGDGKVIYVDTGTGDDGRNGLGITKAVATLARAQVLAVAARGDVIVILPGNYSQSAVLAITKSRLTWISATNGGTQMHFTSVLIDAASSYTDGPAVQVTTANENAFYGLAFGARNTTVAADNVDSAAVAFGDATTNTGQSMHMEGCYFPAHQTSDTLLYLASGSRSSIVGNTFGGLAGSIVSGLKCTGAAGSHTNVIVKDNIFKRLTVGIQLGNLTGSRTSNQDCLYVGNIFLQGVTTNVHNNSTPVRGAVVRNHFSTTRGGNNAFAGSPAGDTVANAETQGWIFTGNTYSVDDNAT